jgi:glutathione S-transferase
MGFASLDPATIANIRTALNNEILPKHLQYFENFLQKSTTGWLINSEKPTIADFYLVPRLQWLATPGVHDGIASDIILNKFPLLKQLIEKLMTLPEIVTYYQTRQTV